MRRAARIFGDLVGGESKYRYLQPEGNLLVVSSYKFQKRTEKKTGVVVTAASRVVVVSIFTGNRPKPPAPPPKCFYRILD